MRSTQRASTTTARLSYTAPLDWPRLLRFLSARSVKGVEAVHEDAYLRTVRIGDHVGWIRGSDVPAEHALAVEIAPALVPVLEPLRERLGHFFDLRARPEYHRRALRARPDSRNRGGATPRASRPGRLRRIRARGPGHTRPTDHGEGSDDDRRALRCRLRRSDRDSACIAHDSPSSTRVAAASI